MEEKYYAIPLRIKEVMREKGVSGKELADRMNKKPQYISNVINGSGVSLNVLAEIAEKLGVDMKDLFASNKDNEGLVSFTEYKRKVYTAHSIEELERIVKLLKGMIGQSQSAEDSFNENHCQEENEDNLIPSHLLLEYHALQALMEIKNGMSKSEALFKYNVPEDFYDNNIGKIEGRAFIIMSSMKSYESAEKAKTNRKGIR